MKIINQKHPSDKEFILQTGHNILKPIIIIRTPTGKRIKMHDGQTALDFALSKLH